ncbi:MAG: acyltransferase [Proteobacteria bacterium]|nr:acyltransferase [Pseudomonadota bacterium]
MSATTYRPEIDGLRALAILLVVLYHASFTIGDVSIFPGGYIGVDVFFVISGYLISRILLFDMKAGTFSVFRFYERRARRILPALITVTGIASVFAWHILMPDSLLEYGRSLLATAFFSANIFFLKLDAYTAELIAHRPLLHMWSLGIEEQFYIVFPLLLFWFFTKFNRRLVGFLCAGFIASLLLAEYCSTRYPGANFYLAPTRVWELVGGSLLACLESKALNFRQSPLSQYLPLLGISAILAFAVFADDGLRHPSLFTFPPVLGTMILIWFADSRSAVFKFLTLKPVVWTGLISYSLYLWHQPVFVFARVRLERSLLTQEKMVLITICFLLAALTYFLVEKPTRNRSVTSSRTIWSIGLTGSLAIALFGLFVHLGEGFPTRFFAAKLIDEAMQDRYAPNVGPLKCKNYDPEKGHCQFQGVKKDGYTLFTVGDSHIRTLDAPIVKNLENIDFVSSFIPLNSGTSFFTFDLDILQIDGKKQTPLGLVSYNRNRFEKIMEFDKQIVITGGRLPLYLEHDRFDNAEGGREQGGKCSFVKTAGKDTVLQGDEEVLSSYQKTIAMLLGKGIKVILIYPIPEVGWDVPKEMSERVEQHWLGRMEKTMQTYALTTSYRVFKDRTLRAYQLYDSIDDHPNLLRIYPETLFCREGRCTTHNDTSLYYRDDNHLSYYGAMMVLEDILGQIQTKWGIPASGDGG